MPSKRTRRARTGGFTDAIYELFKDGTGSERYSDDDIHRLWIAHGEAFARAGGFKPGCWIRNHPASLFALPGVVWTDS